MTSKNPKIQSRNSQQDCRSSMTFQSLCVSQWICEWQGEATIRPKSDKNHISNLSACRLCHSKCERFLLLTKCILNAPFKMRFISLRLIDQRQNAYSIQPIIFSNNFGIFFFTTLIHWCSVTVLMLDANNSNYRAISPPPLPPWKLASFECPHIMPNIIKPEYYGISDIVLWKYNK